MDADGNKYFFNLLTRAMSWTRPVDPAAVADAAQMEAASYTIAIDHHTTGHHHTGAAPLPAGWSEHFDTSAGICYWCHQQSRAKSWVAPSRTSCRCEQP